MRLPRRREDLEFSEIGDELLVYDPLSEGVHCLNRTAALVLQACDGVTRTEDVLTGLDPDVLDATLAELAGVGLLVEEPAPARRTRRELLALMAGVPVITSLVPMPHVLFLPGGPPMI